MIMIDGAKALELLRNVVVGRENFVYNPGSGSCRYVANNANGDSSPSCVVGQALHLARVPIECLQAMDKCGDSAIDDDSEDIEEVLSRYEVRLIGKAKRVFAAAQRVQDRTGKTWGEALGDAESVMG